MKYALGIAALVVMIGASCAHAADQSTTYFLSASNSTLKHPFSDATQVGGILYLSGQIGVEPGTDKLVAGGMQAQARQLMDNIGASLQRHGLGFDAVFKCTVMLTDMQQWSDFNKVYVTYFRPERLPSRSAMGVNGLALNAAVEVECWANTARDDDTVKP